MSSQLFSVPSLIKITRQDYLTVPWMQLITNICNLLNQGFPAPVPGGGSILNPASETFQLAALTSGGTQGSITITGGVVTGFTPSS